MQIFLLGIEFGFFLKEAKGTYNFTFVYFKN